MPTGEPWCLICGPNQTCEGHGRYEMTDQRVEEIRERWEKATDGPWRAPFDSYVSAGFDAETGTVCQLGSPWIENPNRTADAQAIAHAPSDIAYLLSRLKAAEAVVEKARDLMDSMTVNEQERLRTALEEYGEVKDANN